MNILAIETSCDETGLSIIKAEGDIENPQFEIVDEIVATQIETHREWGGVVPHLARREHDKNLPVLLGKLFDNLEDIQPDDIERLAVTVGPGLDPCLWSGINYTKKVHKSNFPDSELAGANHLEGHLYSFFLSNKKDSTFSVPYLDELFPAVQLVVSGGHTIIVLMKSLIDWEILGSTRDDAAGESFDKVARMLDLSYPGGPEIQKWAENGSPDSIDFPRPMIDSENYDFSFSGLKTAVLYYLKENVQKKSEEDLKFDMDDSKKSDVAASFQAAVVDTLASKTIKAAKKYGAKSIMLSGGVAANKLLRETLKLRSQSLGVKFLTPPIKYNTDNGSIIAIASYINCLSDKSYDLESQPNLGL